MICENFYGRNKTLWGILSGTFRWDLREYDVVFGICSAITNYLLLKYPLRNNEHNFYRGLIVESKVQHDHEIQKKSLQRRVDRRNRNNRMNKK